MPALRTVKVSLADIQYIRSISSSKRSHTDRRRFSSGKPCSWKCRCAFRVLAGFIIGTIIGVALIVPFLLATKSKENKNNSTITAMITVSTTTSTSTTSTSITTITTTTSTTTSSSTSTSSTTTSSTSSTSSSSTSTTSVSTSTSTSTTTFTTETITTSSTSSSTSSTSTSTTTTTTSSTTTTTSETTTTTSGTTTTTSQTTTTTSETTTSTSQTTTTSSTTTTTSRTTTTTSESTTAILSLSGVQLNFNPTTLFSAWSVCYTATYASAMGSSVIATILATCNKAKLLLGCRPVGNTVLTVAAMGNRADVIYNCGTTTTCLNYANGVGWYFSDSYSWGFVQGGDAVTRSSCDTMTTNAAYRLCWHTQGSGGYRCGATIGLNSDTTWQKVIYHAN